MTAICNGDDTPCSSCVQQACSQAASNQAASNKGNARSVQMISNNIGHFYFVHHIHSPLYSLLSKGPIRQSDNLLAWTTRHGGRQVIFFFCPSHNHTIAFIVSKRASQKIMTWMVSTVAPLCILKGIQVNLCYCTHQNHLILTQQKHRPSHKSNRINGKLIGICRQEIVKITPLVTKLLLCLGVNQAAYINVQMQ